MSKDSDSTKKSKKSKATEDTATKPNALGYIFATLLLRLWATGPPRPTTTTWT